MRFALSTVESRNCRSKFDNAKSKQVRLHKSSGWLLCSQWFDVCLMAGLTIQFRWNLGCRGVPSLPNVASIAAYRIAKGTVEGGRAIFRCRGGRLRQRYNFSSCGAARPRRLLGLPCKFP
jgi:hypothetical protein